MAEHDDAGADLMEMKTVVRVILSRDERARNSDKHLTFEVWKQRGAVFFRSDDTVRIEMSVCDFQALPSFESIRRVRAEIQNTDGDFLPTDPQILIRRKFKEAQIRRYYGDRDQKILQEWIRIKYGVV